MAWDWDYIQSLIGDAGNQDTLAGAVTNYALTQGGGEGGLRPGGFSSALLGNATRDQTLGPTADAQAAAPTENGFGTAAMDWLTRLGQGDRRAQSQARMGLGALGLLGSLMKKNTQKSPAELAAMTKSPYSQWTPEQRVQFDRYFYSQLPQFQYQPPKLYAAGGNVAGGCACGGLTAYAAGGATHHGPNAGPEPVRGPGGGQDDQVPARLSPGEYVFDADVVSALGDGNNEHGAALLDAMRERIRAHKRSAPPDSIPPKAHAPEKYLKKGK